MHNHASSPHSEKKSLSSGTQIIETTTAGSQVNLSEIKQIQSELSTRTK